MGGASRRSAFRRQWVVAAVPIGIVHRGSRSFPETHSQRPCGNAARLTLLPVLQPSRTGKKVYGLPNPIRSSGFERCYVLTHQRAHLVRREHKVD